MTAFSVSAASAAGPQARVAIESAVEQVEGTLGGHADLAVAFFGSAYAPCAGQLTDRLACLARTSIGVTAQGVICGPREFERPDALTIWAARLPGVELEALYYPAPASAADVVAAWPAPTPATAGLLAFCDPYSFPAEAFLSWLSSRAPDLPVSGGLASGARLPGGNRLLLDGEVYTHGTVAVGLSGGVSLRHLVSQGCRPVGPAYVVTAAAGNVLHELAGRSAADRVREVFASAGLDDRELLQRGLLVGILLDERTEDPGTGDFLVRGVLGVEPSSDGLVLGDVVEVGRTVRFQVRDAVSADRDLCAMLATVAHGAAAGGLLFTCNGRGRGLFGHGDHDAELAYAALGGAPLSGFFAGGEFGPIGQRSWLHGFTASLVVVFDGESAAGESAAWEA